MDGILNPAADRAARVRGAVTRHMANATASWQGGLSFGVVFSRKPVSFMEDAASAEGLHVSMCIANAPGIAEGSLGLVLDGQPCQVAGPVTPDASGWANFLVSLLN